MSKTLRVATLAAIGLCLLLLYGLDCNTCSQSNVPECHRATKVGGVCTPLPVTNNAECDLPNGTTGWCQGGTCVQTDLCRPNDCTDFNECTANLCDPATGYCSYEPHEAPFVPCGAGGVCVDDQCVEGDPCLRPYVGRINCCEASICSQTGNWASTCVAPMADGTPCDPDPSSLTPPGLVNPPVPYEGECLAGECVWNNLAPGDFCMLRPCNDPIDLPPDGDCTRNWCDPQSNSCVSYPIGEAVVCGGTWDGNCLGSKCDDTDSCTDTSGHTPCCPFELCSGNHPVCDMNVWAGNPCDVVRGNEEFEPGICSLTPLPGGSYYAECIPAACAVPELDGMGQETGVYIGCDDGNDCSIDSCDDMTGKCQYAPAPFFTPCNGGLGACSGVNTYCYMAPIPCTEQGLIDAIAFGGGPHAFACSDPTTITLTGTLVIDNDVILDGGGSVTIDGNYMHRLIEVDEGVTAELLGMTLIRGRDTVDEGEWGIVNRGTLTLTDVQVTGCEGLHRGSAPVVNHGSMTLTRCSFTGNTAIHGAGALGNSSGGTLTVADSVFVGNSSDAGLISQGGAIGNFGTASITGTTISNNSAQDEGGGIFNSGDLTITNSVISGNSSGTDGGGIYHDGTESLTISDSMIRDNAAADGGGGIAARSDLDITGSGIFQNVAGIGGGIELDGGSTLLINTSVTYNDATIAGGVYVAAGAFTAISTTISGNTASPSGNTQAMGILGVAAFQNTIITGGCGSLASGSVVTGGGNIQNPGSECFVPGPTDQEVADAYLGPLQADGTVVPLAGSPAIEAVDVAACIDNLGAPLLVDQVGTSRPQLTDCDSGAVEVPCGGCPPSGSECEELVCNPILQACELLPVPDGTTCSFGQCVAGLCELPP